MLTVTSYGSEYCVPSGLDFKAVGDYVVRYFVSNHLLLGLQVTCKHDKGALSWLNAELEQSKERPPPSLADL